MDCIKEKKFLFWKWKQVEHNYKMHRISKFMKTSDTFHVDYKCSTCGATYTKKFVEQDELMLNITGEKGKYISTSNKNICQSLAFSKRNPIWPSRGICFYYSYL